MGILSYGYKALKAAGQAINKTKPNVPETKIQKATRDLKIGTEKLKGSTAKLKQTQFELKNNMPITFKKKPGRSMKESDRKKKIMKDNNKVIGRMFKKAIEGKKDGGRMGLKFGGGADLKDIPAGKKFDGLRKLPKEVRNKMKYKKDGGKI